jgi:hypothetical protein
MHFRKLLACCAAAVAALSVSAPAAWGAECGQPGSDGKPTSGQLTLDTDQSTQTLDFKDSTGKDTFHLYMKVGGCTITAPDAVVAKLRAPGPAEDALAAPEVSAKGTVVVIDIGVTPDKFPAKQVKPVLTLSGSAIDTAIVPLTMQRKQPPPLPTALVVVAALLGAAWALWLARGAVEDKKKAGQTVAFKPSHAFTAVVAGAIAAYLVYKTAYLDPATWEPTFSNCLTMFIGVASAATGGATAGAATAFAIAKQRRKRKPR